MDERVVPIAARKLELCEAQQRVLGLRRERIIHHDVSVITLRVGGVGRERGAPVERLRINRGSGGRRANYRIDECSPPGAVTIAGHLLGAREGSLGCARGRLALSSSRNAEYQCTENECASQHLTSPFVSITPRRLRLRRRTC